MRWKLIPLDGSLDLIQITDETDTILGCLSIDGFRDFKFPEGGPIYDNLWRGHEVVIELSHVVTGQTAKERE